MNGSPQQRSYIRTVKNRCRVCFTCVRKCPAKAIRITKQQAEVIPDRCIGCGNCVKMCSQGAKQLVPTTDAVLELLATGQPVAACLAPSFPAEFVEWDFRVVVGMTRKLGFSLVTEVGFGADLVAERYRRLIADNPGKGYVGTTCPGVVGYVERYQPVMVPKLAPIVSPMIAMTRALRRLHGQDLPVVFIGPCIAKKVEGDDVLRGDGSPEMSAVITFQELRRLFEDQGVMPDDATPSDFDPPHPGLGTLFPLARGILQAARIKEDLITGGVVAADGLTNFTCALNEAAAGNLDTELLELLCCTGCIAGPGMTTKGTLFARRARVSHYVKFRMASLNQELWQSTVDGMAGLDLSRGFVNRDRRLPDVAEEDIDATLVRMGKKTHEDELNCGACGYLTCREHAIAVIRGLAETEMCLPYVIEEFQHSMRELSNSHEELSNAREQLMHSERLATMGQLAAGVAHELNNPLGVVLMYTHLMLDEASEKSPMHEDLSLIAQQADRCKRIVAGLLDFARENKALLQHVKIRPLVQRALEGMRIPDDIDVTVRHLHTSEECELDPDQIVQVLTNLLSNAIAAMPEGGELEITVEEQEDTIVFRVRDTGTGIREEHLNKIFQPFFSTKGGKGTGLGLAVTYGIVKMHRGDIKVVSNADPEKGPTGTTFEVRLPRRKPVPSYVGGKDE